MNKYQDLRVWQLARQATISIYTLTHSFPDLETFGLTQQIRRAAVSIVSNIAEGAGRNSAKDFKHFLSMSLGSCFELETQLLIAGDLKYIDPKELEPILGQLQQIERMNGALQKSLS